MTADLLIPVSVAVQDGKIVVLSQNGTVLDGLVAALNDLPRRRSAAVTQRPGVAAAG